MKTSDLLEWYGELIADSIVGTKGDRVRAVGDMLKRRLLPADAEEVREKILQELFVDDNGVEWSLLIHSNADGVGSMYQMSVFGVSKMLGRVLTGIDDDNMGEELKVGHEVVQEEEA